MVGLAWGAWLTSSPWVRPELSKYVPAAVQLPAETHDTENKKPLGFAAAFAGRGAWTPVAQVPDVWVSSTPGKPPELS